MTNVRRCATLTLMLVFFVAGSIAGRARTGDFPLGTYQSGPFTFTFEDGGTFRVLHSSGTGVTGTYKITGDQIEFNDQDGEIVCQDSAGKYTWKQDHDSLTFTLVDDACDGRIEALTSKPLVKKKGQ